MKERVLNYVKENIKAISICLVLIVVALGLFFNLDRSISQTDHKEFVYIYSDNSDFYEREPGAWILYKNASCLRFLCLPVSYNLKRD